MRVYVCVCVRVYACVCMCVCVCVYIYIYIYKTCFNSLRALRTELFEVQFHIADSSSFFFKGCKIIGTITELPLYSIKVTGVVPGPYHLWGRMFGSYAVVFQLDGRWQTVLPTLILCSSGFGVLLLTSKTFLREREKYTYHPSSTCFKPSPKNWPRDCTPVT